MQIFACYVIHPLLSPSILLRLAPHRPLRLNELIKHNVIYRFLNMLLEHIYNMGVLEFICKRSFLTSSIWFLYQAIPFWTQSRVRQKISVDMNIFFKTYSVQNFMLFLLFYRQTFIIIHLFKQFVTIYKFIFDKRK